MVTSILFLPSLYAYPPISSLEGGYKSSNGRILRIISRLYLLNKGGAHLRLVADYVQENLSLNNNTKD